MNYTDWKNQAVGRHIDVDGYYGAQCVDVYLDYVQKVIGVQNWASVTGYGDAAALYPKANQNYFTKMPPSGIPQRGDVIFYGPTATNSAGHVAIVDSADNNGVTVIEQDGFNPGGSAYVKYRPWNGMSIGWQRPKINVSQGAEIMNQGDVTNMYRVELGRDPDPGGLATYTGKPWHDVWYAIVGSAEYKQRVANRDAETAALRAKAGSIDGIKADYDRKIADLQKQLTEAQNKPPVVQEVIKEVVKEVPAQVDEKRVVESVFVRFWNSLFKKG